MARDGKSTKGPPRLAIVDTVKTDVGAAGPEDSGATEGADGFERGPVEAANDPGPTNETGPASETGLAKDSGGTDGSASPLHNLVQAVEADSGQEVAETSAPPVMQHMERIRVLEAVIFASQEPVEEARLTTYLKPEEDLASLLTDLQGLYRGRGVNLVKVAGKWAFRTADDLSWALERHSKQERRLSKAALETLAIVAYHQPVTRAEIEEVRGVSISKGTLDVLMEIGWVRPRGRRRAPGKPITYGTSERFLAHFGLDQIRDLPGIADLKAQGLLDANLPPDFKVPEPTDVAALMPDELPLEAGGDGDEPLQTELELEPLEDGEDDAGEDDEGAAP